MQHNFYNADLHSANTIDHSIQVSQTGKESYVCGVMFQHYQNYFFNKVMDFSISQQFWNENKI